MGQTFVADELIETACRTTGLDRFDDDSFREGLDVLTQDANRTPRSEDAFARFRAGILNFLSIRLKVADYHHKNPEIATRPIERPVFVFGMPRTGTTLTSNLLASDPARRSMLTWEMNDPVPPPRAGHLYDDPRALARLDEEARARAADPAAGRFYRASAIYPTEDVFPMASDFKTLFWESHGPLPAYGEWLLGTDVTSAYAYHKRFLQLLQSEAPGVWNLKMPSHALYLETLLALYPDARLVWTHRDPFTAIGSLCSLIGRTHVAFLGHTDFDWIGRNYPAQAAEHLNRAMASRDAIGQDRIYDLHYADMIRDPVGSMRRLYDWLGDDFTQEAEAGMQDWLADNPQGKFGKQEYQLAQYGLTKEAIEP
ncbi:MAG: sulfotransferase, partial [Sphingobium sp.]